jgi:hypothetical protein
MDKDHKRDPGVVRDHVISTMREILWKLRGRISGDSRLYRNEVVSRSTNAALERLQGQDGDRLLASVTDYILVELGYDPGAPAESYFSKTRRKTRGQM